MNEIWDWERERNKGKLASELVFSVVLCAYIAVISRGGRGGVMNIWLRWVEGQGQEDWPWLDSWSGEEGRG